MDTTLWLLQLLPRRQKHPNAALDNISKGKFKIYSYRKLSDSSGKRKLSSLKLLLLFEGSVLSCVLHSLSLHLTQGYGLIPEG